MYLNATYVGYGTVSRETGGTIRYLMDSQIYICDII